MRVKLALVCIFTFMISLSGCGATETREVTLVIGDADTIIENDSVDTDVLQQDENSTGDFIRHDYEFNDSDQLQPDQVIDPDQGVDSDQDVDLDQIINPDQNVDFDQVIDPDQNVDLDQVVDPDQVINPDQNADLDQVIDPDQNTEFDQFIDPDQVVDADQIDPSDQNNDNDNASIDEATVHVASWPTEAEAIITGEGIDHTDVTPFDVVLPFGTYDITITKNNYVPFNTSFMIPDELEITAFLEQLPKVPVTFVSGIPGEPEIEVHIDSWGAVAHYTPFTYEFNQNSFHTINCLKAGYEDESFSIEVGTESFEYEIVLSPVTYETYCGWLAGEYAFIEGTMPSVDNVFVTVEIFDDHCEIYGLEPPAPTGQYLSGQYESVVYDLLMLLCPDASMCDLIQCWAYPDIEVIECGFQENAEPHTIVWHKVN